MSLKSLVTLIAASALVAAAFVLPSATAAAAAPISQTEVTFFTPAVPPGAPRDGSCWTRSIAVTRPGAWRCMIGNAIHDPCFQVSPDRGVVVCDADPATREAGFVLKLTKPLPEETPPAYEPAEPWLMQLADGSVCAPFTGTMPLVGGDAARWYCFDPSVPMSNAARSRGLVTKIHRVGAIWTVDRYAESQAGPSGAGAERRVRAQRVGVVKVWE